MRSIISSLLLIVFCAACHPGHCAAAQSGFRSVGVRGGLSVKEAEHDSREYEAFAVYRLPWEWRTSSGWGVATQVGVTAGIITGDGDDPFIGSIGPALNLGKTGFPLELDLGISVAVLSDDTVSGRDLNGLAQFISHAGLDYRFSGSLGIGYRFQHMSNAGINGKQNPGLNMHMLGVSWYFAK